MASPSTRFLNINSSTGDLEQFAGIQTSSGAAQGQIVALNASNQIDASLLPSVAAGFTPSSESSSFSALISHFYSVSLSSAAVTATLPDATTCSGQQLIVQVAAGTGSHVLTIATVSSQDINGAAASSLSTLSTVPQCYVFTSDGSNWWTMSEAVNLATDVYGTLAVANGGTGRASLTAHNVLVGDGTSAVTEVAPSSTSGLALVSGGSSADPAFGAVVLSASGAVSGVLPVLNGPGVITATAGSTNITAGMMIYLDSSSHIQPADNTTPVKATGFAPSAISATTSGQVVIGSGPNAALTGLTAGSDYFLSTAGSVTATVPSSAGQILQKVGTAISTTELQVLLPSVVVLLS
jgi:hypothetical protein